MSVKKAGIVYGLFYWSFSKLYKDLFLESQNHSRAEKNNNFLTWNWRLELQAFYSFQRLSLTQLSKEKVCIADYSNSLMQEVLDICCLWFHWKRVTYSQTCFKDHLWLATICLQRRLFWGLNLKFCHKNDLRNDLRTITTYLL